MHTALESATTPSNETFTMADGKLIWRSGFASDLNLIPPDTCSDTDVTEPAKHYTFL